MAQPHSPSPLLQPPMTPPTITQEVSSLTGTGPIRQQTGPSLGPHVPVPSGERAWLRPASPRPANLAVFALAQAAGTPFRVLFPAHQAAASVAAGDVLGASHPT